MINKLRTSREIQKKIEDESHGHEMTECKSDEYQWFLRLHKEKDAFLF